MKTSIVPMLCTLALAAGCSSPDVIDDESLLKYHQEQSARMSPLVEEELVKWNPDHEDLIPIIKDIFRPGIDVAGKWSTYWGYDGSSLAVKRNSSNTYIVEFSTLGCVGNWNLSRVGTYSNGVLRLNKPIKEYFPAIYDTLYAVSVDRTEYLVSQFGIRYLLEHHSTNGVVSWTKDIGGSSFHREETKNTQPTNPPYSSPRETRGSKR